MNFTQREKKVENGDFGRKLGKVKSRGMVSSEKMRVFELASSSFFHLLLTIFLLCYFELFPVTGAGINLLVKRCTSADFILCFFYAVQLRFRLIPELDFSGLCIHSVYNSQ